MYVRTYQLTRQATGYNPLCKKGRKEGGGRRRRKGEEEEKGEKAVD
jgi:hypothetical protein